MCRTLAFPSFFIYNYSTLIFNAVVKLWKKSVIDKPTLAVFLVVFAGSAFFNLSPILFVILAAVAGILLKNKEVQAK